VKAHEARSYDRGADMLSGPLTWWCGGAACMAVAGVYLFRQPRAATSLRPGYLFWLRWGHSAAWVLLAIWSFARAVGIASGAAAPLALLALLAYAGFLVALLRAPR